MSSLHYKLVTPAGISLAEVHRRVRAGARFVTFPYCISLIFAVTLKRLSPAYLIESKQQAVACARRYNRISYLLGWWCFPWGPMYVMKYRKVNLEGGMDVTEDVLANLTEEALEAGLVSLTCAAQWYEHPNENDLKTFARVVRKYLANDAEIRTLIIGVQLHEHAEAFVIGIATEGLLDLAASRIREALYTQFYKRILFEIIDLEDGSEESRALANEGYMLLRAGELVQSR